MRSLADITKGEEERREAAGVLAQVLSPWIEGNTSHPEIDINLPDVVISLKGENTQDIMIISVSVTGSSRLTLVS